jgi:hypothetical protein
MHNSLSSQIELNPFQEFLEDMVENTYALLEFEKVVPPIKQSSLNAHDLEDDDRVVQQLPDGQLKIGFAEYLQGQLQVWLRENPFDLVMHPKNSCHMARSKGSINSTFHFSKLLSIAKEAKIASGDKAIEILEKIAGC